MKNQEKEREKEDGLSNRVPVTFQAHQNAGF